MTRAALASYLREFTEGASEGASVCGDAASGRTAAAAAESDEAGRQAMSGVAEANALWERRLAEAEQDASRRLTEEQENLARRYGAALAGRLEVGLAALEASLSRALLAVLAPLVEDAARSQMLGACERAVRRVVRDRDVVRVVIRGPAEFAEAVAGALKPDGVVCAIEIDEDADVVIEADETLIRLRLDALKEIRTLGPTGD